MSLPQLVLDEVDRQGPMTVARFMQLALYHPQHGYYATQRRAGKEWFTGPTLHPVFGHTLAQGIAPLLEPCQAPTLVDAGTGSGELARDVALGLHETAPSIFEDLQIVLLDESQAALERAQATLQEAGIGLDAVHTGTRPPDGVTGVILANELLDALPTHLCQATQDGVQEIHLVPGDPTLSLARAPPSTRRLERHAERIAGPLEPGHLFEVPLDAYDWTADAATKLEKGALVLIDYGAPRRALLERYPNGTLHAYRNGHRVEEFWYDPGQMDITYRIPFDEIANQGEDHGLATRTLAPQGRVLDALSIRQLAQEGRDVLAIKKLIDPQGAGGTFHVLMQTKDLHVTDPWPGAT